MYRHKKGLALLLLTVAAIAAACSSGAAEKTEAPKTPVTMQHIHGAGFNADGTQLQVAAHDGLRIYEKGAWQNPNLPRHDYMGFAVVDNGFYSSGHPAPSSKLANPLGLVKTTDGGKNLAPLAFGGELDFHVLGVGYRNHAIYVENEQPTAHLQKGLAYSLDDGKTWKQAEAKGITGQIIQLAVHPDRAEVVAAATEGGLLLSADYGHSFQPIAAEGPISAVAFSPKGDRLYYGFRELKRYDLASRQSESLPAPAIGQKDAMSAITINPARPSEVVLATFGVDIHLTQDDGKSWATIAQRGKGSQ